MSYSYTETWQRHISAQVTPSHHSDRCAPLCFLTHLSKFPLHTLTQSTALYSAKLNRHQWQRVHQLKPKHTDESTWSARRIHLERSVQSAGCQEWQASLRGALDSNVKLSLVHTHMKNPPPTHSPAHINTHAVVPKTGTRIKESIWSAVSLEPSTNFLLQRKADERASHLLHTAQSDSASQIHNSPHTAFWGVAIETLLGGSGQKMRGDERGYFPLHLPLSASLPPHFVLRVTVLISILCLRYANMHRLNCRHIWRSQSGVNNGYLFCRTIHANY